MLYIVKVYEDGQTYEYEYGNEKHAREHMEWEKSPAWLFRYDAGEETLLDAVNQTFESVIIFRASESNGKMRPPKAAKV